MTKIFLKISKIWWTCCRILPFIYNLFYSRTSISTGSILNTYWSLVSKHPTVLGLLKKIKKCICYFFSLHFNRLDSGSGSALRKSSGNIRIRKRNKCGSANEKMRIRKKQLQIRNTERNKQYFRPHFFSLFLPFPSPLKAI